MPFGVFLRELGLVFPSYLFFFVCVFIGYSPAVAHIFLGVEGLAETYGEYARLGVFVTFPILCMLEFPKKEPRDSDPE